MKIGQMFVKPIDRDLKGVIKVGQDDDRNIQQELEEYVVTRELQKHFRDFVEGPGCFFQIIELGPSFKSGTIAGTYIRRDIDKKPDFSGGVTWRFCFMPVFLKAE